MAPSRVAPFVVALFAILALLRSGSWPTPAAAQDASPTAATCPTTTEDENEAIARRWTEEALSQGNLAVLDEIVAADVIYDAGIFPVLEGRDAVKQALATLLAALPDAQFTVETVVTEDNLVVVRWTGRGTHQGQLLNVAPTGNAVEWTGTNIYRIACGQIVEGWSETDGLGLLRQIGGLPVATVTPTP